MVELVHSFQKLSRTMGTISIVSGCVVIAGWAFDIPILRSFFPGMQPLRENAAIAIVLIGIALVLAPENRHPSSRAKQIIADVCASFAALLGFITLLEFIFKWDLGIDSIFIPGSIAIPGTHYPQRMSPNAAACCLLLGLSLLTLDYKFRRWARPAQWMALISGAMALLVCIAYLYQIQAYTTFAHHTITALNSAILFLIASVGVLCARPNLGIMAVLTSDSSGGITLRRVLPAIVVSAVLFGWLALTMLRSGIVGPALAMSVFAVLVVLVSSILLGITARGLHHSDLEQKEMEKARVAFIDQLSSLICFAMEGLMERTEEGVLKKFIESARLLTNSRVAISGHGYQNGIFTIGAVSASPELSPCPPGEIFKVERGGIYMNVIESCQSIRCTEEELTQHPAWWGLPEGHIPLRGLICAPLVEDTGEAVGIIMVSYKEGGDYTEEDEALISQLSSLASLALQHVRARSSAEQRADDLAVINEELEGFSISISDDLKGPMRAVDHFSRALLEDYGDKLDDRAKDYLTRICKAEAHMHMLIDDLIKLSKIARAEMCREQINLSRVVEKIAANIRKNDPDREAEFVIKPDVIVNADPYLMDMAIENLLDNAWKFTSKHSSARIEFGVIRQNGKLVYFVRDDGAGFDPDYMSKLFRPFQRLHFAEEFPGTGIGLAAVKRVIHRHGGRVWAEGDIEKGATVYFTL